MAGISRNFTHALLSALTHPCLPHVHQLILQGQDHKHYWEEIITRGVKDAFPPEAFAKQQGRLAAFAGARGTIVILEDLQAVEDLGKANPFVDKFTHSWSQQSSGMLQINLWNLLTQLGYGANLQHFAPVLGAEDSVREKWLKSEQLQDVNKWKINAELVFGSREGEPKEKGFTDKHRVLAFGQE